eukprot:31066-Pelagococcus_subviridis.AAC.6
MTTVQRTPPLLCPSSGSSLGPRSRRRRRRFRLLRVVRSQRVHLRELLRRAPRRERPHPLRPRRVRVAPPLIRKHGRARDDAGEEEDEHDRGEGFHASGFVRPNAAGRAGDARARGLRRGRVVAVAGQSDRGVRAVDARRGGSRRRRRAGRVVAVRAVAVASFVGFLLLLFAEARPLLGYDHRRRVRVRARHDDARGVE